MKNWIKVTAVVMTLLPFCVTTFNVSQSKFNPGAPVLMASDPSNPLPKPTGRRNG
jgi:hypothetical protein